jgi:hypothetical protein
MRSLIITCLLLFPTFSSFSQVPVQYRSGVAAEDNLNRIINITPTGIGGQGFDSRYQGVKGSPTLFEKLLPSYLKISGTEEFLKLNSDLDIYQNMLVFSHPKTGKLQSIPSKYVSEVIIISDTVEKVFITTASISFEKKIKEVKFVQVLKEGPYTLIKMPLKNLIEASYKNPYSAGIKYDEFQPENKYFIMGKDSLFYELQLSKKSLIRLFPDKKKLIEASVETNTFSDNEEMIISILNKFQEP